MILDAREARVARRMMGEETPAGGGGRDLAAFAAMPSAWVATITLASSAAYLATGAGSTRPHRRRSRRIAGLRARDALDVDDSLARDDSAREDGFDASDDAERGARRLLEFSPSDDLASNGTAPAKMPTRAPRRGLLARALEPVQLALLLARTLDLALFALLAWGVMYVGHDKLCGVVMRCECNFPWMGGWSRCNAHNTHGGPRCPWCTAPYWTSVLTQKSCAAVMIAAYALGAGDPEAKDPETKDARGDCRDARRLPRVASRCASYLELARTDENRRPECDGSNPGVVDGVSDSDSEEAASVAFVALVDDEFDDDAFGDDDGRSRRAVRVPRALPALALALRPLAIFPGKWREMMRLVVSDAGVRVGRFLAPLAWWFAFEMFWQAFFYLWWGARQDPAYPCFLVCWGDPLGPGNNPPSPLSMLDAPPMQRLAEAFGKTG